jgi:hypothetical protein
MDRFTEGHRPPDWSLAWVPDGKLEYYLGRVDQPKSASRGKTFVQLLGFVDSEDLRESLLLHARTQRIFTHEVRPYGIIYNAIGQMRGPNGFQFDRMITGWLLGTGSAAPRNVSAFPDSKRTR